MLLGGAAASHALSHVSNMAAPGGSCRAEAHRQAACGAHTVVVAQVYDWQHAALMERRALCLHTDAVPASVMPSSAGPSSACCRS